MLAITQKSFGGPEVLEVVEVDRPQPMPTEVLVRVNAVSVNPVEAYIRSGAFPLLGEPPFTLGWDVSGVVAEVGLGASRFEVGDEVYGMPFFPRAANGYAEYVAAPSRMLARKPANLDHAHAAALPLVGLTAWQGLVDYAKVEAGQKVLIHAAGGGVGHVAVQIAKARGAYVIGTASAAKHNFVRELGADEVIDYRAVDFTDVVRDADVVYDVIGGDYGERSLRSLRPGGVFVTAVDHGNAELAAKARAAGLRFAGVGVEPDYTSLEQLTALVEAGKLRPFVEHVLPFKEVGKAHELVESGSTQGKIVLTV
ncbi:NADP-dependent oxidoreductase [Solihabitans fulvus]|uniref:NADP-dependent oxidoreductase n=1 Tax=Solihabitans fulvus TaxID=1892852 RepID=A0A5B2XWA6_9PSEU|nr:NADP-dependent oxidoreductase [Solihabitans fulvus]KAA2266974.1 NADP-dependent oxidoreductase [Solihabitans fulvus]